MICNKIPRGGGSPWGGVRFRWGWLPKVPGSPHEGCPSGPWQDPDGRRATAVGWDEVLVINGSRLSQSDAGPDPRTPSRRTKTAAPMNHPKAAMPARD